MESKMALTALASSEWMLPADVMKNRRLKAKRRALHTRMNTSLPLQILSPNTDKNCHTHFQKRKISFGHSISKIELPLNDFDSSELSCDADFFQRFSSPSSKKDLKYDALIQLSDDPLTKSPDVEIKVKHAYSSSLSVDWSLKTRLRFTSSKPFPWKHTFRSSEEASGTTGFVRCMDPQSGRTLDTSKNAQFFQCCLTWQHPSLPMLPLFPRIKERISSQSGIFGSNKEMAEILLEDWKESLRSLFHLVRVRQCPYFYVCGPFFTCLFRGAGIAGIPHAHALVTPTTFGFREEIKKEGIEFTMPLLCTEDSNTEKNFEVEDKAESFGADPDEDTGDHTSWLEDLGIEASKIPNLNQSKSNRIKDSLRTEQLNSLIFIEDMELHGFFNFLLNCTSCMSITGPLAGVPPTLLSPVAFNGGTLKALKVTGGTVRAKDGKQLHNLELSGPILPSAVLQLSSLFSLNVEDFSLNLISVAPTIPFCNVSSARNQIPSAFAEEGLVDCGLGRQLCTALCRLTEQTPDLPLPYKEISFSNNLYTCE